MNSPIPAVTTSEPAGNGVRSWNNDSTSPAAITTDASYVPAFNTPARSNSMRIGLIVLLLTVPPYQILAEGAEEHLRRQGEKNHHKEQANSLVRHDREDTGIQHRTND